MAYCGYLVGAAVALGLGAAILAGSGDASADSTDSGARKSTSTHTGSSQRTAVKKPARVAKPGAVTLRFVAPNPSGSARTVHRATSARPPVSSPTADAVTTAATGSAPSQNLPPSYYVNSSMQSFLDGSWNVTVSGVAGPDGSRDDAEIFFLHRDGENYVGYTRLYLNQTANVISTGDDWDLKAFDPGVLPGDFGLTEVLAGPPRRLPNSAAEYQREHLSSVLGLIPVVAQVVGAVNLVQDAIALSDAQRRGDIDDIADEKADVRTDLIFQVLGVGQLQGLIAVATLPAVAAFAAFYLVAVMQCNAKPGSEACWALI